MINPLTADASNMAFSKKKNGAGFWRFFVNFGIFRVSLSTRHAEKKKGRKEVQKMPPAVSCQQAEDNDADNREKIRRELDYHLT